jgi:alpha-mannosidase
VKFDKGDYKSLSIIDAEGGKINSQISVISEYEDKSVQQAEISFIAADIPPIGYKTYYITRTTVENKQIPDPYESKFFKLTLTDGGIESIYDKELERELIDPTNFNAGEVFTMNSEGNGAGEFADIQQPTMLGFDRTGNYKTKWVLLENGPVYSSFKFRQQIRNAVVEQKVILYKEIKKMDFHISLLNWEGVLYREYRMALPLNINEANIAYETAFGVSQVGKDEIDGAAGERYTTPCEQVHPRGIENWIGAFNEDFGVTLSSSVAVADYIDPTSDNSGNVLLQPILLASRRSCHELGNEYLQTGDHHFKFSLTSHTGGWENGFRFGKEANENLFVLVNPQQYKYANLTEEHSFFSVDGNNVIISTIKKAEDDDAIIIRMYDILGLDQEIELTSSINVSSAFKTNLIEEVGEKLINTDKGINLNLGKYSIETIKVFTLQ